MACWYSNREGPPANAGRTRDNNSPRACYLGSRLQLLKDCLRTDLRGPWIRWWAMHKPHNCKSLAILLLNGSLAFAQSPATQSPVTNSTSPALSTPKDIGAQLNATMKDKVIILRHFYTGSSITFDENGNPSGRPSVGPWTLNGELLVSKVTVENKELEILGDRVFVGIDNDGTSNLKLFPTQDSAEVTVRIKQPFSFERLIEALHIATLAPGEDIGSIVPELWRDYFKPAKTTLGTNGTKPLSTPPAAPDPLQPAPVKLKMAGGVVAGFIVKKVPPVYPEIANSIRRGGTSILHAVIGVDGRIEHLRLLKPAGFGMDEAAADAVMQKE